MFDHCDCSRNFNNFSVYIDGCGNFDGDLSKKKRLRDLTILNHDVSTNELKLPSNLNKLKFERRLPNVNVYEVKYPENLRQLEIVALDQFDDKPLDLKKFKFLCFKNLERLVLQDLEITEFKFSSFSNNNLKILELLNLFKLTKISDFEFLTCLNNLTIHNCPKLIISPNFCVNNNNLKELYLNFHFNKLQLPKNLEQLTMPNVDDCKQILVNNGYYDEQYLTSDNCDAISTIKIAERLNRPKQFKRKCVNLNWLFKSNNLWDWHLNLIIDEYLGLIV